MKIQNGSHLVRFTELSRRIYSIYLAEARDLIKNIIQKDPSKRLTIPQILAHSWFTSHKTSHDTDFPITNLTPAFERSRPPSPINTAGRLIQPESLRSSEASTLSVTSDSPFISSSSEYNTSTPTTPDDTSDPFQLSINTGTFKYAPAIHRNPSETTLRKTVPPDIESLYARMTRPVGKRQETVVEEDDGLPRSNSSGSKAPPVHPVRTPARTKRRSVSSTLSDPASPTLDKIQTPLPAPQTQDIDFASLLSTPSPIIFSTALERELLNSLSLLGFDTAQIVHSVLTDACDAAGAVWWMLKKKAEKKLLEDGEQNSTITTSVVDGEPKQVVEKKRSASRHSKREKRKTGVGVQTEYAMPINVTSLAPQLSFVPPTPTFAARPTTPPRPVTPTRSPLLSPSSSTVAENSSSRSHPSTPGGSMKDRDGAKSRKPRSGSVSIMQRATTALEAAGLVKKKSSEVVREDKEREKEKEKSKDAERKLASGEESRSSHGSGSSKLTKSPPLKASKEYLAPTTPPPGERPPQVGSPWILTDVRDSVSHHTLREAAATPTATPGMQPSASAPTLSGHPKTPGAGVPHRNRANLLTAFRTWFNEDRKGRRKDNTPAAPGPSSQYTFNRTLSNSGQPFSSGSKRHTRGNSGNSAKYGSRTGASRAQRQSVSSRRSSSVNSRRSSGASAHQMIVLDSSPHLPTRRSLGSHTPNSERDYSSRPSSIRSIPMPRHRKSPSASSAGSTHYRTASPMQKYHKRGGSGSSTRVVRQIQTTPRAMHARSNSAASSVHSPPSSRPTSFYEFSEGEGPRATSPYKSRSRRRDDRAGSSSSSSTTFVAQKRQGPFMSPVNHGYAYASSIGRSSWKKSWGLEPPGWQSRTAHLPVEVLAISPAAEPTSIRDVFSGRHSLSLGDESDWVDEDDDIPAFAGGLGQMGTSASSSSAMTQFGDQVVALSPPPRGHRPSLVTKRSAASRTSSSGSSSSNVSRQKPGHSPVERVSPIPSDSAYETSGRRQLPASRSGPAFRHAIQEEDEGEEE